MIFKKIFAIIASVLIVLSLTACQNSRKTNNPEDVFTSNFSEESTDAVLNNEQSTEFSSSIETLQPENIVPTTPLSTQATVALTKAEIIEMYKKAAQKSNADAKCEQVITLSDISINNGQYSNGMKFVKSIISVFLNNNSTEIDGITGGFSNLTEADVADIKTYQVGDNTAIEMVMKEQSDGANGDKLDGSVGHAIAVVGDISVVADGLKELGLPIEISKKDTSIHYTKPVVKVLIDPNGKIIKGTWRYTVDIRLNNYKVAGTTVNNTSVVMDNVITLNGGFDK